MASRPLRLLKLAQKVYIGDLILGTSSMLLVAMHLGANVAIFCQAWNLRFRRGKEQGTCTVLSTSFAGRYDLFSKLASVNKQQGVAHNKYYIRNYFTLDFI
jgi:hypothetical protein